jgi:predicted TIM-barrel fold metal-dependent hydrolase
MTTRRRFLHLSAATAVGGLSQCSTLTRAGAIDAHVHVWTPDTVRYPLAEGFQKSDMQPASFTPAELFAHCRPEGVSRIVLIQMSYYRFDNRYMLDSIAAHPGVFSGVAIVDEHAAGLRDRMRDLARQGVRGFRIYTSGTNVDAWLGSAGMAELWKVAADENLNVCLLINPEALAAVNRMCDRFPRTPVVIDHFARLGMAGPVERGPLDRLLHLSKHSQVHVKTSEPSASCGPATAPSRSGPATAIATASPSSATASTSSPPTTATGCCARRRKRCFSGREASRQLRPPRPPGIIALFLVPDPSSRFPMPLAEPAHGPMLSAPFLQWKPPSPDSAGSATVSLSSASAWS